MVASCLKYIEKTTRQSDTVCSVLVKITCGYLLPTKKKTMTGGFIYTRAEPNKGADLSFYKRIFNNPYIHLQRIHFFKILISFRSLEEVFLVIKSLTARPNTISIGQDV